MAPSKLPLNPTILPYILEYPLPADPRVPDHFIGKTWNFWRFICEDLLPKKPSAMEKRLWKAIVYYRVFGEKHELKQMKKLRFTLREKVEKEVQGVKWDKCKKKYLDMEKWDRIIDAVYRNWIDFAADNVCRMTDRKTLEKFVKFMVEDYTSEMCRKTRNARNGNNGKEEVIEMPDAKEEGYDEEMEAEQEECDEDSVAGE